MVLGRDVNTNKSEDYVIKLLSSERMRTEAFQRELIASFIASEIDICVPQPTILSVSHELCDSLRGNYAFRRFSESIGYNFGTKYLKGCSIWLSDNSNVLDNKLKTLQKIFVFDTFINNTDRTKLKPNLLTNGNNVYIYDHELSFGFLLEISPNQTPWLLDKGDKTILHNHILLDYLKGKEIEDEVYDNYNNINTQFWDTTKSLIPIEWSNDTQFEKIKTNLNLKLQNFVSFKENILNFILS